MNRQTAPATLNIIIVIGIVFFCQLFLFDKFQINEYYIFADFYPDYDLFRIWQPITHMFFHDKSGFTHVLFNLIALYTFGSHLERLFGSKKFLILFFVSGIIGSLFFDIYYGIQYYSELHTFTPFSEGLTPSSKIAMGIGASGAIYGIMVVFAVFFPNLEMIFFFIPYPIKAKYLVPGIIGLDVLLAILNLPSDPIAHSAHIGGAVAGFLLAKFYLKVKFKNRNSNLLDY